MNVQEANDMGLTGKASRPPNRSIAAIGLFQAGILMLAAVLAWQAMRVNLADYFAQEATPDTDRQALGWHAGQPQALAGQVLREGITGNPHDPILIQAARTNPADGRLFASLALQAEKAEASHPAGQTMRMATRLALNGEPSQEPDLAGQAMQLATRLAPQRTDVRLAAYRFWLRRGDPVRALREANVALNRNPGLAGELFPQLLALMRHPRADEAYLDLLKNPVSWWTGFFGYVAAQTSNSEVVRTLLSMQKTGPNAVTDDELKSYLARLERDGLWLDAYFTWLNSVPRELLHFNGEVYDGGFEEPSRNLGFEWIEQPVQGVLIGFDSTYGTTGSKALHVVFQGLRARWRHFQQYLMLAPGDYSLRGRVRIDSLETEQGVRWAVSCRGAADPLVISERFKGTDQWRYFQAGFSVPADCPVQELRLELVGQSALDFVANGQIWFDDITVFKQ